MKIIATVKNVGTSHEVAIGSPASQRSLNRTANSSGNGSAVSGGELLIPVLATCYGNDIYREAAAMRKAKEITVTRILAFLAVFTAVLLAFGCGAAPSVQPAPLVGAWRSSVQFKSGMLASIKDLEFMYVFNAGGTLTESSNYDAAPPVPPAYGVWREIAPNQFEARYEFFATAPAAAEAFKNGAGWLPAGRGVLIERITLSADAQTFTSTIRYDAFDLQGGPAAGGGEAEGRAQRIQF